MADDGRYKRGNKDINDFFESLEKVNKNPQKAPGRPKNSANTSARRNGGQSAANGASPQGRSSRGPQRNADVRDGGQSRPQSTDSSRGDYRNPQSKRSVSAPTRSGSNMGQPARRSAAQSRGSGGNSGARSGRPASASARSGGNEARPRRTASPQSNRRNAQPTATRKKRSDAVPARRRRSSSPEGSKGLPGRFGRDHRGARKRSKHPVLKSIITIMFILVLVALAAVVLYVYGAIKDLDAPNPKEIEAKLRVSSTMYDRDGEVIKDLYFGEGQRVMVTYDQLPKNLQNAFVAIEDKTFWDHHGFNFVRIIGALRDSIVKDTAVGGTSTISQQLARNVWLSDTQYDRDMKRKVQEAYYAVQLENNLSKEEILTDYLNTISLGYHSLGVGAAAKNYFNKSVEDLDLLECAALASLPKSPTNYAMIKTQEKGSVEKNDPALLLTGSTYDYLYNDTVLPRIELVLDSMLEQELITQAQHDEALAGNLRDHLKPTEVVSDSDATFFVNWAIDNVAENLMKQYDNIKSKDEALQMVYGGGFAIHTTYDKKVQKIVKEELEDPSNYPSIIDINKDDAGNILDDNGKIMLFSYSNIFEKKGVFTFGPEEATRNADGSITIMKGYRINLYSTTVANSPDVSIEFKDMYQQDDSGRLFIRNGGVVDIPQGYKTMDSAGNCNVSASFFKDFPDAIKVSSDGKISIPKSSYTLKQKVIQPQGSMVILDHRNGQVLAMSGGRGVKGEMNYNRALEPRQPGSAMKPIGTYGPAIQMSAEKEEIEDGEKSFGKYWSPLSIIRDEKFEYKGKVWPKNWYSGYRGPTTFRKSVEQSMNVNAVKVQLNVGNDRSVDFLKKLGITSLVLEGKANDLNPAALALGGMTKGLIPLEAAAAYGAFANKGILVEPIAYTQVLSRTGETILDGKSESSRAMDEGTAFIMNDILRTTVTQGIAGPAAVDGVPVGGKTGTTSDSYDLWFVGNTPKLSAAAWFGNDVNLAMYEGGKNTARLWGKVMNRVMDGRAAGEFPKMPSNVVKDTVSGMTDYFIKGTKPDSVSMGSASIRICKDSGLRATDFCPNKENRTFKSVNGGDSDAPRYYCNLHNPNPGKWPIPPSKKINKDFDPDDPDGSKKKQEEEKQKKEEEKRKKEEEEKKKQEEEQTPVPDEDSGDTTVSSAARALFSSAGSSSINFGYAQYAARMGIPVYSPSISALDPLVGVRVFKTAT